MSILYILFSFFEIFQYSLISLTLTIIFSYVINTLVYRILKRRKNIVNQVMSEKNEKRKPSLIYNLIYLVLGVTTIIILTILIEKTCLLMPSIPKLFSSSFQSHQYKEYIFHVALFISFIEFLPHFKKLFFNINQNLITKKSLEILLKSE